MFSLVENRVQQGSRWLMLKRRESFWVRAVLVLAQVGAGCVAALVGFVLLVQICTDQSWGLWVIGVVAMLLSRSLVVLVVGAVLLALGLKLASGQGVVNLLGFGVVVLFMLTLLGPPRPPKGGSV